MRRSRSQQGFQHGFTMIEVLVALAIIAVALAASLRAVGSMAAGEQDLHRRLLAGWSADNELAQLRLSHTFPDVGLAQFRLLAGQSEARVYAARESDAEPDFPARRNDRDDAGTVRHARANGYGGRQ